MCVMWCVCVWCVACVCDMGMCCVLCVVCLCVCACWRARAQPGHVTPPHLPPITHTHTYNPRNMHFPTLFFTHFRPTFVLQWFDGWRVLFILKSPGVMAAYGGWHVGKIHHLDTMAATTTMAAITSQQQPENQRREFIKENKKVKKKRKKTRSRSRKRSRERVF